MSGSSVRRIEKLEEMRCGRPVIGEVDHQRNVLAKLTFDELVGLRSGEQWAKMCGTCEPVPMSEQMG